MSAVLQEAATPANDETVEVLDRAEITDGKALVSYSRTELALADLEAKYKGAKFDLTTVAGDKAARAARLELVTLRTSLDKKRKEFKGPVLEIGRLIDSEAKRITDKIKSLEDPIDAQIVADEARRETIRQEKAKAEAARQQAHRDGIAKIRSYADAARLPGMTAERLLKGLSALEAMVIDPAAWEEFATEAAHVLAETTEAVKAEHAALVEREAEAARLAQQAKEQAERKAELDRIAAEQKAQADALAAQQAEIARQAEALAEQQRAAAAAEAQRLQDEQDREDARRRALALEAEAAKPAAAIPMQPAAAPEPVVIPVAEVIEHAEPPAPAPMVDDDGREWKLVEIAALFGVGLTAETVRSLGIEPMRIDAFLFTTSQVLELRARLVAHLLAVEVA